jgi:predicted helicase
VTDLRDPKLTDEYVADCYFPPSSTESSSKRKARIAGISKLREQARALVDWHRPIIVCAFRPFDNRWCYFSSAVMDRPRKEILDNVAWRENIQLLVSRQIGVSFWRHISVTDEAAVSCYISDGSTEQNYCFPAYLYSVTDQRTENLTPAFRAFLDARYDHHYTPEEILGYIYAVLHAPSYRARYGEFLRIDFPRIPFPENARDFEALSGLGWTLVQAHLLRELPRRGLGGYYGKGGHEVEAVRYVEAEEAILINKTQCFRPVPRQVWEFHIGGYRVIDKYLKSRKGRVLTLDEINHVAAVADCLAFTVEQMAGIDGAYLAAFPDRG